MAKAKSKSIIMVPDGAGGMTRVEDRRFEKEHWPISFEIPTERDQADRWLRYLGAECHRRGWGASSVGQLERGENSGSIAVNTGPGKPQLAVVWERKRGGPVKVRARSVGTPEFALSEAREFFERVNNDCRSAATERTYRRGTLQYSGLAWRGELWLEARLRLAPPSRQDETAVLGPRIVHVDAMLDCIGTPDVPYVLDETLRELSAFLSVVMGTAVRLPEQGRAWTWPIDSTSAADCEVRCLGYLEIDNPTEMPQCGACRTMPLRPVNHLAHGIDHNVNEQSLRVDVIDLWRMYRALTPELRRQFLQAAAKWQEAMTHWGERSTLSFALMAVGCEALKPTDADFRTKSDDVIEALLGKDTAQRLRQHVYSVQLVRNSHLHVGEFHESEFVRAALMSSYRDPSFMEAHRDLARVTPAAIIEWLTRGGKLILPVRSQRKPLRRWIKENALIVIPTGIFAGLVLGWFLRMAWEGF